MKEILIPFFVYVIPVIILGYMSISIFLRNIRKMEHRLLSIYFAGYAFLFVEEYIRQMLPIEYSPMFVNYLFGNTGLLILCVFIHFTYTMYGFKRNKPKWFSSFYFYVPLIPVILTVLLQKNFMNSQKFVKVGYWIYPEFNVPYLITLTVANLFNVGVILVFWITYRKVKMDEQKKLLKVLIISVFFVLCWDMLFGYVPFRGTIPPYSYIFGGLIFSVTLSYAMYKYEFLSSFPKRYETLHNLNPAAIVLIDMEGYICEANPSACQLFQRQSFEQKRFEELIVQEKRQQWLQSWQISSEKDARIHSFETMIQTASGLERYVLIEGDFVYIDHDVHMLLIIRDIHDQKLAEEKVHFLAYHDALTKLANRSYLYEKVDRAIAQKTPFAVVVIDLDGFKQINDRYGHHVGDLFLIHLANLLEQHVEGVGLAVRLGGDEFCLVVRYETDDTLQLLLKKLFEKFQSDPMEFEGERFVIRASIGVSIFPTHGNDIDMLLKQADEAMYAIKSSGKNGYRVFAMERCEINATSMG